jgi:hypothetical protein
MKKPTNKQLTREVLELKAQLASAYHFAAKTLGQASTAKLMASGVLVQLTGIGGKELVVPFMVKDGLSEETIEALHSDITKSYDMSVMFKP